MSAAVATPIETQPESAQLTQDRPEGLRPYADYSIERKAEVLALVEANAGNIDRTARETGIPHQTIRFWQANKQRFSNLQTQKQIDLSDIAEANARLLGQSIANHDLEQAPLGQKATAFGIMVDKMQLLRSQPTQITANVNIESLTITLQQVIAEITSADSTD